MPGVKGKSGGKRAGAGRKPHPEKTVIIKIKAFQSLVTSKGGEEKARRIMLEALICAPVNF